MSDKAGGVRNTGLSASSTLGENDNLSLTGLEPLRIIPLVSKRLTCPQLLFLCAFICLCSSLCALLKPYTYTSVSVWAPEPLNRQGSLPVESIWIFLLRALRSFRRHIGVGGCANIRTRRVSGVHMTVTHLLCCDSHTLNSLWVALMHHEQDMDGYLPTLNSEMILWTLIRDKCLHSL